jgi:hypothetical protein
MCLPLEQNHQKSSDDTMYLPVDDFCTDTPDDGLRKGLTM